MCAEPNCPTLITDSTRCELHRKAKRRAEDKRRPNARARGYDTKWERTRTTYLRDHPICENEQGCIEAATDLDHIDGNPFNRDWSNYRGLCHRHHSQRTARDQPGGFMGG